MNRATFRGLSCIVLLLYFTTYRLHAQIEDAANNECQILINKGSLAVEKNDFVNALEYFTKAEVIAENKQLKQKMFHIKNNLGRVYMGFSNYGEALGYYQEALNIATESGMTAKIPTILNNIGILYANEKDYLNALTFYKKGYSLSNTKNYDGIKTLLALNISDVYNNLKDFTNARKYLMDVQNVEKSKELNIGWKINYAESYFVEGDVIKAQAMMESLLATPDVQNDKVGYRFVMELLSQIYAKQNKTSLAVSYAKKALGYTFLLSDKIELYSHLSKLYLQDKNYSEAFLYKDSVISAKDNISVLINKGLYESNKVKLKVQEYQNELLTKDEKQQRERILFTGGIIFIVLVSLYVYRWQKNKIIKHRQEKIISENREKIFDLELKDLKNNIAEKNRKLSANALYLSGRNGLIDSTIQALAQIPQVAKNKEVAEYINTLKGYLKTDAEWDDFITYFEQVNPEFLKTLKQKHPDLSPADIRFICYVYMNLDTREIGNIFNITYNASRKRKMRIKEKIGIKDDDSLYEYLLQIVTT